MKRKLEELRDYVVSKALDDFVDRIFSAVFARYDAHASVDDQLERLDMLVIMLYSAVEAADGVHIRSWWLRRWLWKLRDAAHDGNEVLRLFRRRRALAEEGDGAGGPATSDTFPWWNIAKRAFRSAKSLLFQSDEDVVYRLRRTVANLEKVSTGVGDFLNLLDSEIKLQVGRVRRRRQTMSAAFGSHGPPTSVDVAQLERVGSLLIIVHRAVDYAMGVQIRSWWLRRWLWRLRDIALHGDEVLLFFRQQRTIEWASADGLVGSSPRNAEKRLVPSAKSFFFPGGDDTMDQLSRMVARLEMLCTGISDFYILLDLQTTRSRFMPHI